jgi:hypothetical protein
MCSARAALGTRLPPPPDAIAEEAAGLFSDRTRRAYYAGGATYSLSSTSASALRIT